MFIQDSPSPELSPLGIGEDLTPLPALKSAGTTAVDFAGLLAKPLQLHEDLASGCGGQLWPVGLTLGKHMLRYHRHDLADARMTLVFQDGGLHAGIGQPRWIPRSRPWLTPTSLELGAGGGLVGLAVASGCAITGPMCLTDQANMLPLMEHNIQLNGLAHRVRPAVLNWGEPLTQDILDFNPNVILAADCVYFEPAFPLLMTTLSDLLAQCPSATIYFCCKKRRRADTAFLKKAHKKFHLVEVHDEDRPSFSRDSIFLYTITSKAPRA